MENDDEGLFNLSKPIEDTSINYYHQYCRLYLANVVLTSQVQTFVTQVKELLVDKSELQTRLNKLQDRDEHSGSENTTEKSKRHRRTASEISRHYKCSVEVCQKSYGSEGSLNQHIRLKHPELFKEMSHFMNIKVEDSEEVQEVRRRERPHRLR